MQRKLLRKRNALFEHFFFLCLLIFLFKVQINNVYTEIDCVSVSKPGSATRFASKVENLRFSFMLRVCLTGLLHCNSIDLDFSTPLEMTVFHLSYNSRYFRAELFQLKSFVIPVFCIFLTADLFCQVWTAHSTVLKMASGERMSKVKPVQVLLSGL